MNSGREDSAIFIPNCAIAFAGLLKSSDDAFWPVVFVVVCTLPAVSVGKSSLWRDIAGMSAMEYIP